MRLQLANISTQANVLTAEAGTVEVALQSAITALSQSASAPCTLL